MMRVLLAMGMALALAMPVSAVRAQTQDPGRNASATRSPDVVGSPPPLVARRPSEIVPAAYTRLPTEEEMSEVYPEFANAHQIGGQVQLRCIARVDTRLDECVVISAAPDGLGFGPAALRLTPLIRTSPLQVDGVGVASRINFRLVFRPEPDDVVGWTGPEPSPEQVEALRPVARRMLSQMPLEVVVDGLDEDRREVVVRIQEEGRRQFDPQAEEALALGLARVMTTEQQQAMVEGRPLPGRPPDARLMDAAGDQVIRIEIEYRQYVRDRYCALYTC